MLRRLLSTLPSKAFDIGQNAKPAPLLLPSTPPLPCLPLPSTTSTTLPPPSDITRSGSSTKPPVQPVTQTPPQIVSLTPAFHFVMKMRNEDVFQWRFQTVGYSFITGYLTFYPWFYSGGFVNFCDYVFPACGVVGIVYAVGKQLASLDQRRILKYVASFENMPVGDKVAPRDVVLLNNLTQAQDQLLTGMDCPKKNYVVLVDEARRADHPLDEAGSHTNNKSI